MCRTNLQGTPSSLASFALECAIPPTPPQVDGFAKRSEFADNCRKLVEQCHPDHRKDIGPAGGERSSVISARRFEHDRGASGDGGVDAASVTSFGEVRQNPARGAV